MKLIRKILFACIAIFLLLLATGVFIAEKYEKVLINYLIKDVDKFVKSEIRINKVDVTFLKKFPNISVWLKNTYIESKDKTYSDTLLFVEDIYLQFDFFKLIKKDYVVNSIILEDGQCNLNISSDGNNNYIFWTAAGKEETTLDLKLDKIKLNNISVTYNNQVKLLHSKLQIKNTLLSGKITNTDWAFDITQNLLLENFSLKNSEFIEVPKNITSKFSISNDSTDLKITDGLLSVDKTHFLINGSLGAIKAPLLNLSVSGKGLKINDVLGLFNNIDFPKQLKIKSNGEINFLANIKGKFSHKSLPHISGNFNLADGGLVLKKQKITIDNINLDGAFDNHNKKTLNYSTLLINNFNYTIENKTSKGNLLIENFHKPKIELTIAGNAPLELFENAIKNPDIEKTEGYVTYDIKINGKINSFKKVTKKDIQQLNILGKVQLDDCNIFLNRYIKSFQNIKGEFTFGEFTSINNLSFNINKNDFLVNGQINNLNNYLLQNEGLIATIELFSNQIDITDLIQTSNTEEKEKHNKKENKSNAIELPDRLNINGNFVVNNFKLGDFAAKNARGKMKYRNKLLTLNSVFFESMEGNISGGGVLTQTSDNNFSIKAQSKLNHINITEMMKSFHNFGQNIINENQISGYLNGNATLSTQLYNNFKINKNSFTLDSYSEINNGRLANFTPLMGLSKFFRTAELADIHFSRFENSIAISDKTIYFTDMKINSSVTDLMGSGIHSFDNSYEYKVKVKLSDILSGKIDKPEITSTPFGEIEEKEIKNTYIPIIISGVGDDYKVNPDFEETKKSIKSNVEKEKQTLKTIFKDEFGKKKGDSIAEKDTTKKKKPTFKIEWEEDN